LASRRRFLRGSAQLAGLTAVCGSLLPAARPRAQAAAAITSTEINGLTLLQGAGCNVLTLPGDNGALMIDGGLAANAEALLEAVLRATGNDRVEMLINTHWHPEQTGANEAVGRAGGTILAHTKTHLYLGSAARSSLFPDVIEPLAEPGRPNEIAREDGTLEFGGTRIDYGYLPQAHTDGDLYVHFPGNDVLAAGGVVSAVRWPLLDYLNGAWYGGRVRALQWLAELVTADTRVVPAEGPLLSGSDIVRLRDIYLELFETLIGYMNMGYGAEDAVRDNPLRQYESEFGDASAFLDGAYRSMMIAYVPE
jgi:glyoxylase-like metal-dependent hydrolase (beta-lactamase superfamily II)